MLGRIAEANIWSTGSQSVVWGSVGIPETISGGPSGKNNDHNNIKILFGFFPCTLSQKYSGIFQKLYDLW